MIKPLSITSTISSQLMRNVLFKGCAVGATGIFILILATLFLHPPILEKWGWSLFLMSLGLITIGLLPYRYLCRLQLNPNELVLLSSTHIAFYAKGKKLLTMPLKAIAKTSYIDHPKGYGISIVLKPFYQEPILIHQSPQEINKLRKKGQKLKADLFFPYFNRRAYDEWMDWQNDEEE